jgi:hypothetical protein
MKQYYVITKQNRQRIAQAVIAAPEGHAVRITEQTRSLDQNALMWPLLQDISRQVDWYGNKLTDEEWKDVFSASLKKQKVVPGLDGGFVVCGQSTSKMGKKEFSDLIELIYAFGAQRKVKWSNEPVKEAA